MVRRTNKFAFTSSTIMIITSCIYKIRHIKNNNITQKIIIIIIIIIITHKWFGTIPEVVP